MNQSFQGQEYQSYRVNEPWQQQHNVLTNNINVLSKNAAKAATAIDQYDNWLKSVYFRDFKRLQTFDDVSSQGSVRYSQVSRAYSQ